MNFFTIPTEKTYPEIEELKNSFIDTGLLFGTILGFASFFTSFIFALENGLELIHFSDFIILLIFVSVYIFRKKFKLHIKTLFILIGLFLFFVSDLIANGVFSDNKVLVIALIFIVFVIFNIKLAVWVYAFIFVCFAVSAFLHISGILGQNNNLVQKSVNVTTWITNFILITIVTFAIILLLREFYRRFLKLMHDFELKNIHILEKENNYTEIFNATTNAIFIHDMNGKILEVNEYMLELYKYSKEEIKDLQIEDFSAGIPPYDNKQAGIYVQEAIEKGTSTFDWRAKSSEGKEFWAEVTLKKTRIGGEDRILAIVKDIDEQKRTKIELEKYKDNLELLVRDRTEELEASVEELNEVNEELLNLNESIEKQKKVIQKNENRLNAIIQNQGEGLMITDFNEKITFASHAAYDIFEMEQGDLIGRDSMEFLDESELKKVIEHSKHRKQNKRTSYELNINLLNGKKKTIMVTGAPDIDDKGKVTGTISNFRDITDRLERERKLKDLNEELEASNEELNEANDELSIQRNELQLTLDKLKQAQQQLIQSEKMASLGVLSAGVAHEINNPLNFILGGITGLEKVCKDQFAMNKDQTKPFINAIKEGVDRASDIVSGLSQFSRQGDSGDEDCDIHKILENCLTILRNKLRHRITTSKNFMDGQLIIKGNQGKLHQIFLNILSNAEQAITDKGEISISTNSDKNDAVICIEDSGTGIKKEHLSKVTDPFFTTKDPGKGTGLGLSIVYQIIKEHKGEIEFSNVKGKGTKVIVKLPKM